MASIPEILLDQKALARDIYTTWIQTLIDAGRVDSSTIVRWVDMDEGWKDDFIESVRVHVTSQMIDVEESMNGLKDQVRKAESSSAGEIPCYCCGAHAVPSIGQSCWRCDVKHMWRG